VRITNGDSRTTDFKKAGRGNAITGGEKDVPSVSPWGPRRKVYVESSTGNKAGV